MRCRAACCCAMICDCDARKLLAFGVFTIIVILLPPVFCLPVSACCVPAGVLVLARTSAMRLMSAVAR